MGCGIPPEWRKLGEKSKGGSCGVDIVAFRIKNYDNFLADYFNFD